MPRSTAIVALAMFSLLAGCGRSSPTSNGGLQTVYYPLTVGSCWRYSSSTDGTVVDSITVASMSPDSCPCVNRSISSTSYRRSGKSWLYQGEVRQCIDRDPYGYVLLRLPLEEGRRWRTFYNVVDDSVVIQDSSWYAGMVTIATPAGVFEQCALVLREWQVYPIGYIDTSREWYAPNVGLVCRIELGDTTQLVSYTIKQ